MITPFLWPLTTIDESSIIDYNIEFWNAGNVFNLSDQDKKNALLLREVG